MAYVFGSGPAGLTAAYLLAKRGYAVTLVEKAPEIGGLWASYTYKTGHVFEKGMHWYTSCGDAEIDEFWWDLPVEKRAIPLQIAGCAFNGRLQLNSPYPDLRYTVNGGLLIPGIVQKFYGTTGISRADAKIVPLDRVVGLGEKELLAASPEVRKQFAWPEQRTTPEEWRSGRMSFYPEMGMKALVSAAAARLFQMGVKIERQGDPMVERETALVFWAASPVLLAQYFGLPTHHLVAPRSVTVVDTISQQTPPHDLHHSFDYEIDNRLLRTTFYDNFVGEQQHKVSFEFVETSAYDAIAAVAARTTPKKILGTQNLKHVLPVPTPSNEDALEAIREQLATGHGFWPVLIGGGAKRGLFYQPEVLRHVKETIQKIHGS